MVGQQLINVSMIPLPTQQPGMIMTTQSDINGLILWSALVGAAAFLLLLIVAMASLKKFAGVMVFLARR